MRNVDERMCAANVHFVGKSFAGRVINASQMKAACVADTCAAAVNKSKSRQPDWVKVGNASGKNDLHFALQLRKYSSAEGETEGQSVAQKDKKAKKPRKVLTVGWIQRGYPKENQVPRPQQWAGGLRSERDSKSIVSGVCKFNNLLGAILCLQLFLATSLNEKSEC